MKVTFQHIGLTFAAEADFYPYVPGRLSGPPEDCYPSEGGYAEITALKCGESDAMFLMRSDLAEALDDAAYQACVEQDKADAYAAQEDRYEARRDEQWEGA